MPLDADTSSACVSWDVPVFLLHMHHRTVSLSCGMMDNSAKRPPCFVSPGNFLGKKVLKGGSETRSLGPEDLSHVLPI